MDLDLKLILDTAGPTASLVFASWIFLQYLNQRITEAYQRFREMLAEYRQHSEQDVRHQGIHDQILQYRARCALLGRATGVNLIAAAFLLITLVLCIFSMALGQPQVLTIICICCSVIGIGLLLVCVVFAWLENRFVLQSVDSELKDIPELARYGNTSKNN